MIIVIPREGIPEVEISGDDPDVIREGGYVMAEIVRSVARSYHRRARAAMRRADLRQAQLLALLQINEAIRQELGMVGMGYAGPVPDAAQRLHTITEEADCDDQS